MEKEIKAKKISDHSTISIHDCLKMIGLKEVAANIYCLPGKNKKAKVQ